MVLPLLIKILKQAVNLSAKVVRTSNIDQNLVDLMPQVVIVSLSGTKALKLGYFGTKQGIIHAFVRNLRSQDLLNIKPSDRSQIFVQGFFQATTYLRTLFAIGQRVFKV